ncbi:MAG: J domain-containing protein [Pirellulales bacterium]
MAYDPFELLGIQPQASESEIRQAYLRRAQEVHPDLHPDAITADADFKRLRQAYDRALARCRFERSAFDRQQPVRPSTNRSVLAPTAGNWDGRAPLDRALRSERQAARRWAVLTLASLFLAVGTAWAVHRDLASIPKRFRPLTRPHHTANNAHNAHNAHTDAPTDDQSDAQFDAQSQTNANLSSSDSAEAGTDSDLPNRPSAAEPSTDSPLTADAVATDAVHTGSVATYSSGSAVASVSAASEVAAGVAGRAASVGEWAVGREMVEPSAGIERLGHESGSGWGVTSSVRDGLGVGLVTNRGRWSGSATSELGRFSELGRLSEGEAWRRDGRRLAASPSWWQSGSRPGRAVWQSPPPPSMLHLPSRQNFPPMVPEWQGPATSQMGVVSGQQGLPTPKFPPLPTAPAWVQPLLQDGLPTP